MPSLPSAFQTDPDLAAFINTIGPCPLRVDSTPSPEASLYTSLLKAITGQQLHNAAARAIFGRLCALNLQDPTRPPPPEQFAQLSYETLRGCGLSQAKIDTIQRVAIAQHNGSLPSLQDAITWSDSALINTLTQFKGIGRWTAEMLLLFTFHRPDIFPAHDLGVREGWRRLKQLAHRPTPKELLQKTTIFAPHRSTLTWYCWEAKAHLAPSPSASPR
ncbi:DNA-3-methyladenine glycosylase family protein [Saccharibacter floricola]|uniref:DNA-3-methyladenine glycosylase II n=1 Tax=Saccharibacter floricola DSM 15669 TaxID=1123227 RepID=A0ABQ0NXF0_9PROT|nr:DNA-3-methyladenine glycosylase [Saccharibacter floricola]GBQ05103.1 DNA-3-methyladenine glycosylase [Saccharibacter floricola DSM 15669]